MKIYCPECGSEVAKIDIFCQYCGIGLTPIPTGNIGLSTPIVEETSVSETPQFAENNIIDSEPLNQETNVEDAIPATPYVLSDDFQQPVAHLDELLNKEPIADISTTNEINNEFTTDSPKVDSPIIQENVAYQPESLNEVAPTFNQPEPLKIDSFEQTPTLSDETPIALEPANDYPEVVENKTEDPVDQNIVETNEPSKQETDFDSTIPYVAADYVKNDLQFSNSEISALDKLTEYKEVIETPTPINLETDIDRTTPPHSELGVFPQIETTVQTPQPVYSKSIEDAPFAMNLGDYSSAPVQNDDASEISVEEKINSSELPTVFVSPSVAKPIEQVIEPPKTVEEVTPIEEIKPIEEVKPGIADEKVEARSFTNPIGSEGVADTDGKNKTKLKPLEEGTVLNNRYEIIRKIGGGGMGAVYLASDKNLGGILRAVKEMVQSYIEEAQQDKAIADFKRESLLLTSLDHASIPTIFDYFYDEKEARFYLVMKYISGGDLSGRMRSTPEGRIDEVTVTDWAIQIADVLEYLHRHEPPIVYRDLKPSNIMIDGNSGKVMLIDFGIARWVNKEEKGVTAVGTMGYAPPELFSGNVEPRSDIYSLGSTMFHLLTGADPQSNPLLIFDFNKNPRPRQINSQLSDQIEQILMRSVEYNAAQRFTSAAEMRDALAKHLENLKRGNVTFGVSVPAPGMPLTGNLPVFCGFCGQKILATDMFCPFCGAQQPLAGKSQNLPNNTPAFSGAKSNGRLIIIGTNDLEHTEFSIEKDNNLIGRRDPMSNIFPEVDLSKYDPQTKISRKHARIWRENDGFLLEDLGSSNGTILISVNNQSNRLLPRQPHALAHGDKIRVGDTTLQFTIG